MSDDPTEQVQEDLHHHASHSSGSKWITAAATTAAIIAAFAATAGALATSHLTQSTLIRIKANDNWNYYQAKSIKSSLLDSRIYYAQLSKIEPRQADLEKKAEYARQMTEIQASTRDLEKLSRAHLETHETYEGSATLFHIAIAIVAISVVAKRKELWYLSIVVGLLGIFFFAKALIASPPRLKEEEGSAVKPAISNSREESHGPKSVPQ
jgi:hypothetical protein